jgi:hypothetical protein
LGDRTPTIISSRGRAGEGEVKVEIKPRDTQITDEHEFFQRNLSRRNPMEAEDAKAIFNRRLRR